MSPLTQAQRYQIQFLAQSQNSQAAIARAIGVHRSTLSREIRGNAMSLTTYNAEIAHARATRKHTRAKRFSEKTWREIAEKIHEHQWSPEQITLRFRRENRPVPSHETIYQRIYRDKTFGAPLIPHLRRTRKQRQKRGSTYQNRGKIPHTQSIHHRPPDAENRTCPGHYEVDTLIGKQSGDVLVSIVDRHTRRLWLGKAYNKSAGAVSHTIIRLLHREKHLHTLTFDNGKEFANHALIAKELGVACYFADPYSSWQRGTNENTNGLIRQYLPKKTDFQPITLEQLQTIETKLNNRPRKILGALTPNELHP